VAHGIQVYVLPDLERVPAHSLNALARFISDQKYKTRFDSHPRLQLRRRTERTKKVKKKGKNIVINESVAFQSDSLILGPSFLIVPSS